MPKAPPRACPRCNRKTQEKRCPACDKGSKERFDERRGTAASRGYDATWKRFRDAYLKAHPLCVACKPSGHLVPATEVDHVIPLASGGSHCDEANSQALCKSHHSQKTARERVTT